MLPDALRAHFTAPEHSVYLDHAAVSPLPVPARNAMVDYLEARMHFGHRCLSSWEARVTQARQRLAQLLNVPAETITFTRNTSYGLNLVASGLDWRPGDNVVVPRTEFVANVYPWRNLERHGVEVRFVPDRQARILPEDVDAAMDHRTRLLAVSFVEFATGYRNDLAALKEMCHRRGIPICVDGIQGLGVLPLDAGTLELDFVAAGAPKWLLGPIGVGFLYIRPDWLSLLDRTITGWQGVADPDDYFHYDSPFRKDALRYEEGSRSLALIIGWNESLGLLLDAGIANIEAQVRALTDRLIEGLQRLGKQVITPHERWEERSGIVSFVPTRDPEALAQALEEAHLAVSRRGDTIRVSPHGYNTLAEVETFLEVLAVLDR